MDHSRDQVVARANAAMVVVTVATAEGRDGCLVGFHTQSSIDPWRYTVFLSRRNATTRLAFAAEHLCVHFLHAGQRDLAERFGGRTADDGVDKFDGLDWVPGPDGMTPRLVAVDDWLCGRIEAVGDAIGDAAGDHLPFVLGHVAGHTGKAQELLRYAEVRTIDAGHAA
jgi:flavin reductase (DIM6/NTAB) family NADH-FMN oxidoreductase RutF